MPKPSLPYMTVVFLHTHDIRAREQLCEQLGQVAHLYGSKIVSVSHCSDQFIGQRLADRRPEYEMPASPPETQKPGHEAQPMIEA